MKITDLLNMPVLSVKELAHKYGVSEQEVEKQLLKGMQVEKEHSQHVLVARRIALAHLGERLDYYDQLSKIDEVIMDNVHGLGNVPDNQNVDYLGMRVRMTPHMFLQLATHLRREDATSLQHIRQHISQGKPIASPWLVIHVPPEWEQDDYTQPARVVGHEGRNRMMAIQDVEGDTPVEVHLFFSGGLRARDIRPEWISHMRSNLQAQHSKSVIQGDLFTPMNMQEHTTRTTQSGAPGTLKAKITRLYGGAVTCDKAERLKRREGATVHDKSQANWFLNMNCGGASKLTEVFTEPSMEMPWRSYGSGESQFWESQFKFDHHDVTVEMHPDVRQVGAKYVFRNRDVVLPTHHKGWVTIFKVDDSTDLTGKLGNRAISLMVKVVQIMRGFLDKLHWDYVMFTGEAGSRDQLYQVLAQKLADQIGAHVLQHRSDFVIHKPELQEQGGVGLVVPGVNMPAGMHPDEIRRQAKKFGFNTTAQGVPPITRSDGKY